MSNLIKRVFCTTASGLLMFCLLISFCVVNPARTNVTLPQDNVILIEDFELGTLDPRISISTIGTFNSVPSIKTIPNFGSPKAFGFGLSTCPFDCFLDHVTTLRITLPTPTFISNISFKEMELFDNWGSQGKVFLDGVVLSNSDFGRLPVNDRLPDSTFRARSLTINRSVTIIELRVEDITNLSEIYIDDLVITGDVPVAFQITSVSPDRGGNTGIVTATIRGSGFQPGAVVRLREGNQVVVTGQNSVVTLQTRIRTTFDLRGQTTRALTLEVVNPDGASATLPQGFTIEEGRSAQVWVDIIGRGTIRAGRESSYQIVYGNRGNIDALGVPLWLAGIPKDSIYRVSNLQLPALLPPSSIPLNIANVPLNIEVGQEAWIPLFISSIPPGVVGSVSFSLTIPTERSFQLRAWTTPPYFGASLKQNFIDGLTAIDNDCLLAIGGLFISALGVSDKCAITWAVTYADVARQAFVAERDREPNSISSLIQILVAIAGRTTGLVADCALDVASGAFAELKMIKAALDILSAFSTGLEIGDKCFDAFGRRDAETSLTVSTVRSYDPNDKVGSQGKGNPKFLSGEEPLRYSILFENVETATAPAQEVVITDQLDTSKMDLSTLSLGPISFGNKQIVPPPGLTEHVTTVDLRPAKQLLVNVEGRLNKTTGLLTWRFTSIDPVTGKLPDDPLAGFMPPNKVPPEGDGSVLFTVMPKKGLSTGTEIRNQARVFFDANVPIDTPHWFNTLDNTKPTSNVLPLPSTQSSASFNVQWQGTDVGSGVLNYTIFVSENGGPFTPWLSNISATSGTFTGQSDKTYGFYSVAQDQTGNREDPPSEADATTQVVTAGADLAITNTVAPNPVLTGSNITYTITVANNGPGDAEDVTVTDNLPASTTFVSCSSTGGVCGGSGNNRTITFTSLAPGTLTITLVASVNCSVAHNTAISNTATVSSSTPDPDSNNNSAMATTTASNPPPVITASANPSLLWPPNHQMVNVAVNYRATDNCDPLTCTLSVISNEPISGTGDGDTGRDWEILDANRVRLRAERAGNGTGRIYTITITCHDSTGNSSSKSVTAHVPRSLGQN